MLSVEQWRFLLEGLKKYFIFSSEGEATVECNPESSSLEKFDLFLAHGINRLSVGLQSTEDCFLKALGRVHDFARFQKTFEWAGAAGFRNINIDLIYGMPGQTLRMWQESLKRVLEFSPEHVSVYPLTVEDNTVFGKRGVRVDGDLQADMFEAADSVLCAAGFVHYEISNFCRPGYECRHNLKYWRNEDCLGAGVSAAWYIDGIRRKNTENLDDYLSAVKQGESPVIEETVLSGPERAGENIMLALRLKEGKQLSSDEWHLFGHVVEHFANKGFLLHRSENHHIRPTLKGWRLSNQLFQELLSENSNTSYQ